MFEVHDSTKQARFSHKFLNWFFITVTFATLLALGGCKKKIATAPPPPPPAPTAPSASLTADPAGLEIGQSSTLAWQTQNATEVTLDGENVEAKDEKKVSPAESTTYHLIAKGPGGTQMADARITVTVPPPPPPVAGPSDEELFSRYIKHLYFDYDKFDIRPDQQAILEADAKWLSEHPNVSFTIEGHCDERGSIEYNLSLGDSRATAVKNALVQLGISPERVRTISYGKEKPFCSESSEECWQQNRRGYFEYRR